MMSSEETMNIERVFRRELSDSLYDNDRIPFLKALWGDKVLASTDGHLDPWVSIHRWRSAK